jgi:hypothetical protein
VRRALRAGVLAGTLATSLAAQSRSADVLQQATQFYERLDVEHALTLLRQIVSPNWGSDVSATQRVEAYKYLGACLALTGKPDSAVVYFRAAVERDPFAELDPNRFTPAQVRLFGEARRRTFAVAVRPIRSERIDPRTAHLSFTVVSTHAAALQAELRAASGSSRVALFSGGSEGLREIRWDGLQADGRLAPPGRYAFVLTGRSQLLDRSDSARVFFDLGHEMAPLEDTLPNLAADSLLPERRPTSGATDDLIKGLVVAGATAFIAGVLPNRELGGGMRGGAAVIAGAATVSGVVAFVVGRRHGGIPENIAANDRRRAERAAHNAAIQSRNAAKVAGTILVVSPAAGTGP